MRAEDASKAATHSATMVSADTTAASLAASSEAAGFERGLAVEARSDSAPDHPESEEAYRTSLEAAAVPQPSPPQRPAPPSELEVQPPPPPKPAPPAPPPKGDLTPTPSVCSLGVPSAAPSVAVPQPPPPKVLVPGAKSPPPPPPRPEDVPRAPKAPPKGFSPLPPQVIASLVGLGGEATPPPPPPKPGGWLTASATGAPSAAQAWSAKPPPSSSPSVGRRPGGDAPFLQAWGTPSAPLPGHACAATPPQAPLVDPQDEIRPPFPAKAWTAPPETTWRLPAEVSEAHPADELAEIRAGLKVDVQRLLQGGAPVSLKAVTKNQNVRWKLRRLKCGGESADGDVGRLVAFARGCSELFCTNEIEGVIFLRGTA